MPLADAPTRAATYTRHERSLFRRALLPSPLEEPPGPARVDSFARLRALFMVSAILIDVGFYFAFRGRPGLDGDALIWFVSINIPLLAIAGALDWFVLRRKTRWFTPVQLLVIGLELFTSAIWIQLTGSVSSYFLMVIPLLILAYRLYGTYTFGLIAYLGGAVMQVGMVVLEELGVLHHAPLFVTDPGAMYSSAIFRWGAVVSMQSMFLAIFMLANVVSRSLREKETELDVAQRNLDRVVQPGRLSSQILDGKYQLGELLGRGGMGEVYQAKRVDGEGEVAVKVLYAHLVGAEELERFRREAAIASKLPSEHVARVLDVGHARDGGHHYLVMELLRGEDLGTLLRRRARLAADELMPILEQLAVGLEAAHALGVVHRDLKPGNVFIAQGGKVKLLDFGVARLLDGSDLTRSDLLLGSPGYLAPEQAATEFGEVGPRADVFALGAIIYRAVTGQSAFAARNPGVAVYEVVHSEPPPPTALEPSLPPAIDAVIARALAKKPAQRYAKPSELVRDLRLAFAGQLTPGDAPTLAATVV